jgi:hypothetical protein
LKPRIVLVNLLLVAAIAAAVWQGYARWREAQTVRKSALETQVPKVTPPPPAPSTHPDAPPAAKYVDVATNNLFSKDRNPTVVIEPPKLEKPKEMPKLPVVYGVLGLPSGIKALMAEKAGAASVSVHSGDSIGEFKIEALDSQNVTFTWEDKEIHKKIEDLMDRSTQAVAAGPSGAGPAAQPNSPAQSNPPPPPVSSSGAPQMGIEVGVPGHSERVCVPGDNSAAGTVVDGYKKVLTPMPFGVNCRWLPVQ